MAKIRTRARAVDMLGRQQIAGTQNAINELFKNAHDAYAKQVRVDFFEDEGGFLVIRDDGVGMTKQDFEEKWLVLGTESKTGDNEKNQYRPPGMEPRPVTGEKGIGRLAIALLGKQVLVLTRAIRDDGLHDLVIGLVHWGLFEMPGLNLDEIEIPVETFPGGTLPGTEPVKALSEALKKCVNQLSKSHPNLDFQQTLREIERFQPDPSDLYEFLSSGGEESLSLKGGGAGTHFIIAPANPVLTIELEAEERNQDYSFRRQLLGFTEQVFGQESVARISTSFQHWKPGTLAGQELLDPDTFFTQEELKSKSDHLLQGTVDEFGQFRGKLRVYEKVYDDVIIPWADARGTQTECGPFTVVFGYLMGRAAESLLPGEEYKKLYDKLRNIGGLYLYRDNIRILPYGDNSFDWLGIEERRNLGAAYYFFAYRRMFGAVLLTKPANISLEEKAGREGLQQNKAYRQLRGILINLLIQLAAEFFRGDGEKALLFESTQSEMKKRAKALEKQQKQSTEKRKRFAKSLEEFFVLAKSEALEDAIKTLRGTTRARMEAASQIEDQDKAAAALIRAEREAVAELYALRDKYVCKRPAGVALTKELTREWDGYRIEKERLESRVFGPFQEEIAETLGQVATRARLYIDQRKRLEERLRDLAKERQKQLQDAVDQARDTASYTRKTVFDITQKAMLALDYTVKQIEADLNRTDLNSLSPEKIESLRKTWEDRLMEIESQHREALMAARDMLASLAENLRGSDGEEPAQIMEALEQRMLALEEEADENFEMVQLGLAVAIINHEFAAAIQNVRRSVQELGQVSHKSATLRPLYQSIRTNFEHLDGHLKLFTPLQRRLYRSAQEISGKSIRNYVLDLFGNRLERHNVVLECTDAFLSATVECYPSTLYPAIINLIDNGLFWLGHSKGARKIRFDVSMGNLIIANTGPAIEERDQQRIFERGFTRKPGGRGLGMFISAKALEAENMHLHLDDPPPGFSVAFRIAAPKLKLTQA
jgi:signal transduction histidine kinase